MNYEFQMNHPIIKKFAKPKHISDYPTGPSFEAGHLVSENAGWRTEKPIINTEACNGCFQCYLYCPEGVIFKKEDKIDIDYAFCKGCGICARACSKKAITMIKEGDEDVN